MKKAFFATLGATAFAALLISGCSNIGVRTNAGDIAIGNVKAGNVDTYTSAEMSRFKARFLGEVTTYYCENSLNPAKLDNLPSLSSMAKSLKVQVSQRGGNAIVMKQCGRLVDPSCSAYLECNGEAYSIDRGF